MNAFAIGSRRIGDNAPCFVIAEAGINHNGDMGMALDLIRVAVEAGCDAVKFQTYRTGALAATNAPMAEYQKENTGRSGSQADLLVSCELDVPAHEMLLRECKKRGILFLSTPFDDPSLDLLAGLGVPALKISSGDVTNLPFLRRAARLGVPIILSTGMATMDEVRAAVRALGKEAAPPFALLHCVSSYPADPTDCNLPAMKLLQHEFGTPVGFSDHTTGFDITLAAVSLGASIIEKHITLDRNLPGPDHRASIEPAELKSMMVSIRRVEAALIKRDKTPSDAELQTAAVARKSLHFRLPLSTGTLLQEEHLTAMRPGTGIPPSRMEDFVGKRLVSDVEAGTMLSPNMLE